MIPYIHVADLEIGPFPLHPFGVLVVAGILVGSWLANRRARQLGYVPKDLESFITSMLVGGFVFGHVLDSIFYHPSEVRAAPWSLLFFWAGLSSFGGFTGALLGALYWKYFATITWVNLGSRFRLVKPLRRRLSRSILPYCDLILAVFPVAWALGRLGCSVVHDHPGLKASANNWFAVAYGPGPVQTFGLFELRFGNSPRYDLGLLEFLFTVVLAVACAATWRKRMPVGFYAAVVPLVYAPVRFALDYLRVEDAAGGDLRYARLTPAQWGCLALFIMGAIVARRVASERRRAPSAVA